MKNVIAVAVRGLKRDSWNLILLNDWLLLGMFFLHIFCHKYFTDITILNDHQCDSQRWSQ